MHTKTAELLQAGVSIVCTVDPDTKKVTVNYDEAMPKFLGPDDMLTFDPILPNFAIPVRKLFAD